MKVISQSQLNIYFKGNVETKAKVPLLRWVDVGQRAHRNELIEFDARCIYMVMIPSDYRSCLVLCQ